MTTTPSVTSGQPDDLVPEVIDLTDGSRGTVTVKFPVRTDPFATMTDIERRRLLVRVLCELVAYDEVIDETPPDEGPSIRIPAYTRPPAVQAPALATMTPF